MAKALGGQTPEVRSQNICLVPEWRVWRWAAIRKWHGLEADGFPDTQYLPVFYMPLLGRSFNDGFYARALKGLSKNVRRGDIVYASWLFPDGVAAVRVFRGTGAKIWLMALGSDTFHMQSRRRRRKVLGACDNVAGIVCVADAIAKRLAEAGVPREKLKVVPNGVEKDMFRPRDKQEAWRGMRGIDNRQQTTDYRQQTTDNRLQATARGELMANGGKVILFVGNLVPVKGPDVLLKAFAMLGQTADDRRQTLDPGKGSTLAPHKPRLLIIGSGPLWAKLETLARDLGIADNVMFMGRRSPWEVALWMNVADCLCLTSLSEGMPNVVLEARASGLPVVTTPAGECPELPLDREGLHVVADCTPEAVAEGLERVLKSRVARNPDPAVPTWDRQAKRILELVSTGLM
jgi:teichuronic acid biosynthesis glycosyltransferase TuaC